MQCPVLIPRADSASTPSRHSESLLSFLPLLKLTETSELWGIQKKTCRNCLEFKSNGMKCTQMDISKSSSLTPVSQPEPGGHSSNRKHTSGCSERTNITDTG